MMLFDMNWITVFVLLVWATCTSDAYRFAVIPKRTNSPFFDAVREGCEARASKYTNVECVYTGPSENINITERQVEILEELLPTIDGFAIAVRNSTVISELIQQAVDMGKFVVTFDSDAADSQRSAYVGTDNYKFGGELAHVLLELSPKGGTYGIVSGGDPPSPNLQLRIDGVRDGLKRSGWEEVANSPVDGKGKALVALDEMERLMQTNPDIGAFIPIGGWPMYEPDEWEKFVDRHPQVVTVCADALEVQVQLMNRGKANGLVGQLPFQMGELAIEKLYALTTSKQEELPPPFENGTAFSTSVLNVLQIPQNLPPLQEDMNYIGRLAILGYVFLGLIVGTCIVCAGWTFVNREHFVVKASQPPFLYMICVGVLIMGSAIVPLSLDDERTSISGCSIACMSVPWLLSVGFVTTFSALFSKTWRINQIYKNAQAFRRVRVTAKDVLVPFVVLMTLNIIVLLCWTLIAPLQYERKAHTGTDNWNRVSRSYYGACFGPSDVKGGAVPYVVCLIVINISVLCLANFQAYQAREIKTDYSESKYIGFVMLTMLQSLLVGLPILALVRDDPQAYFVCLCIIIFATCMGTMLFLFVPKMSRQRQAEGSSSNRGPAISAGMTKNVSSMNRPISTVAAIRSRVSQSQEVSAAFSEGSREERSSPVITPTMHEAPTANEHVAENTGEELMQSSSTHEVNNGDTKTQEASTDVSKGSREDIASQIIPPTMYETPPSANEHVEDTGGERQLVTTPQEKKNGNTNTQEEVDGG